MQKTRFFGYNGEADQMNPISLVGTAYDFYVQQIYTGECASMFERTIKPGMDHEVTQDMLKAFATWYELR